MTFVGVDSSAREHTIHVTRDNGEKPYRFTISNDLTGFQVLDHMLRSDTAVMVGFEMAHGPLVDFLRNRTYTLYSINPLKIKRFKETVQVAGDKNDNIDALAIAEYLRSNMNRCRPMTQQSVEVEKLKHLSIVHARLTEEHARYLNKLHFAVREYFGVHEGLFGEFGGKTQLALLQQYTTFEDLSRATNEELTRFLQDHSYRNKIWIDKIITKIRAYKSIVSPDRAYAYPFEVTCLCTILGNLKASLERIEKEMVVIVAQHPLGHVFRSLPGAGTILSAKMLALFGDNTDRFTDANGAQCLFGTAPRNYQSGSYHKVVMRRACNKSARACLYTFAFASLRLSPWARAYYDAQRARGKTHSVSIRALSNKWVPRIFSMWKHGTAYDIAYKNRKIA